MVVLVVIVGADGFDEIESFGGEKLDWLFKFVDFDVGILFYDIIMWVLFLIKLVEF